MSRPISTAYHFIPTAIYRKSLAQLVPAAVCSSCGDVCLCPVDSISSGYALTEAGGLPVCYRCCALDDLDNMLRWGSITLYLVKEGITNWPGSLRFPLWGSYRQSRRGGGMGAQRTDAWFVGPDGYIWHAINRGDNDIASCRRTRDKLTPQGVKRQRKIYGMN